MTNNDNLHDPEKDNNLEPATERESTDPAPTSEEPVIGKENPMPDGTEPVTPMEEPVVVDNVPTVTEANDGSTVAEPVLEEVPESTSSAKEEPAKAADAYDPAATPVTAKDSKRPMGTTIGLIILATVAIFAGIFGIFVNATAVSETRDAIERVNLDTYGLSVVKDSIRGNQFLATGSDPNSDMNYYVQCKLDKYKIDGEKKGIVFCESTFVTEVNLEGDN